jgi:NAD-dependent deacetylase
MDAGARLVVANGSPTPYDAKADAVLRDDLTRVLPALLS